MRPILGPFACQPHSRALEIREEERKNHPRYEARLSSHYSQRISVGKGISGCSIICTVNPWRQAPAEVLCWKLEQQRLSAEYPHENGGDLDVVSPEVMPRLCDAKDPRPLTSVHASDRFFFAGNCAGRISMFSSNSGVCTGRLRASNHAGICAMAHFDRSLLAGDSCGASFLFDIATKVVVSKLQTKQKSGENAKETEPFFYVDRWQECTYLAGSRSRVIIWDRRLVHRQRVVRHFENLYSEEAPLATAALLPNSPNSLVAIALQSHNSIRGRRCKSMLWDVRNTSEPISTNMYAWSGIDIGMVTISSGSCTTRSSTPGFHLLTAGHRRRGGARQFCIQGCDEDGKRLLSTEPVVALEPTAIALQNGMIALSQLHNIFVVDAQEFLATTDTTAGKNERPDVQEHAGVSVSARLILCHREISSAGKDGKIKEMLAILNRMTGRTPPVFPSPLTFEIVIRFLLQRGSPSEFLEAFSAMHKWRYTPHIRISSQLLEHAASSSSNSTERFERVKTFRMKLMHLGIHPAPQIRQSYIIALAHAKSRCALRAAHALVTKSPSDGIPLSRTVYSAVLEVAAELGMHSVAYTTFKSLELRFGTVSMKERERVALLMVARHDAVNAVRMIENAINEVGGRKALGIVLSVCRSLGKFSFMNSVKYVGKLLVTAGYAGHALVVSALTDAACAAGDLHFAHKAFLSVKYSLDMPSSHRDLLKVSASNVMECFARHSKGLQPMISVVQALERVSIPLSQHMRSLLLGALSSAGRMDEALWMLRMSQHKRRNSASDSRAHGNNYATSLASVLTALGRTSQKRKLNMLLKKINREGLTTSPVSPCSPPWFLASNLSDKILSC